MTLTQKMTIQVIARLLKGQPVEIDPNRLPKQWRKYWDAMIKHPKPAARFEALTNIASKEDMQRIIGIDTTPAHYPNFAEIEDQIKEVSFLWNGRIPNGKITVVTGKGGSGKSMLVEQICHLVMHKKTFPDGAENPAYGKPVLYVDCEGFASGIKQRVNAWNTNKNKLHLWSVDFEEDGFINFSNQAFRDELMDRIEIMNPKPALVVIDSLGNAKEGGQDKVEDVRDFLNFINKVASSYNLALILIAHTRKPPASMNSNGEVNQDEVKGSSHIVNMARSVIGVWQVQTTIEPDPDAPRVMAVLKANYTRKPPPIGFDILNDANGNPKFTFLDEAPKPYKEPTKTDLCMEWMIQTLTDEGKPIQPKTFLELAIKAGYTRPTLYEAHRQLERQKRIMDTHGNKHPDNTWKLIK